LNRETWKVVQHHQSISEPLYLDTVTALMTKLIDQHNKSVTPPAAARIPRVRHASKMVGQAGAPARQQATVTGRQIPKLLQGRADQR
jgi:hypothetical protein